jgi:hypothetical protein
MRRRLRKTVSVQQEITEWQKLPRKRAGGPLLVRAHRRAILFRLMGRLSPGTLSGAGPDIHAR